MLVVTTAGRLTTILASRYENERAQEPVCTPHVLVTRSGGGAPAPPPPTSVEAAMWSDQHSLALFRLRARQVERDALASLRSPEIRARLEDLVAA